MAERADRLRHWLATPLGGLLIEHERHVLNEALDDVFGIQLVQIGTWGDPKAYFPAARTQRQTVICSALNGQPQVFCKTESLPVASDSVDAVLLPHTLEADHDPHAVLREVARVLVAEGQILVLGFSAVSTWGARHRLSREGFPPGLARIIPENRLRDWLALLGFEVTAVRRYLHRLPLTPRRGASTATRSDGFTPHHLLPAGAYLIKARKRTYTLTPIRPKRRERRSMVGGLVEPTPRVRS
jgi:SAM-dependent methyltransferase